MEGLSPTLKMVMVIRQNLESGESIRQAIRDYLGKNYDEASQDLALWLAQIEKKSADFSLENKSRSNVRCAVFDLIFRGLGGEPILQQMILLEDELNETAKCELEQFSAVLPMRALIPLLLFQFPALLILLFGPLLRQMIESF